MPLYYKFDVYLEPRNIGFFCSTCLPSCLSGVGSIACLIGSIAGRREGKFTLFTQGGAAVY